MKISFKCWKEKTEFILTYVHCRCIYTVLVFSQPSRLTQPGHPTGIGRMRTGESWGVNRHHQSPRIAVVCVWSCDVSWYLAEGYVNGK